MIQAQHLDAHLVKLPQPPLLRAFVPEHGADGIETLHRKLRLQAMLDKGPQHRGGALRPHGDRIAVAVGKGVHLFFDDIGGLADGSGEQLGFFQDRHPDFGEPEAVEDIPGGCLDMLPDSNLIGEDILKAFQGLYAHRLPHLHRR